jgi:diketogulonate reductase-like aldo/keto reductase
MKANDYWMLRRTFLGSLAAMLASCWLVPSSLRAASPALIRKAIPTTGETVPVIGLGSSRTFDIGHDEADLANLAEVMQAFFQNGGELIDSSPMYGSAEQVIGALLKRTPPPGRLFAATKVWTDGARSGIQQMQDSLQAWGLSRFDLVQIHNLRDWQTHLKSLKDWKKERKTRYIGITTSHGRSHQELEEILRNESLDFVQFSYNIGNRSAEERLLPLAAERGMAVLINRPFQRGALFERVKDKPLPDWAAEIDCKSWGQFFLKFIASHPAVTCVIPATSKLHHLRDNMAAGFGKLPDPTMRQRMLTYFESI